MVPTLEDKAPPEAVTLFDPAVSRPDLRVAFDHGEDFRSCLDAVIVISNDSDLALPIRLARQHVPVGLLNPSQKPLATRLQGKPSDGVGQHWWRTLTPADFTAHQMPNPVGSLWRPVGW